MLIYLEIMCKVALVLFLVFFTVLVYEITKLVEEYRSVAEEVTDVVQDKPEEDEIDYINQDIVKRDAMFDERIERLKKELIEGNFEDNVAELLHPDVYNITPSYSDEYLIKRGGGEEVEISE